MSRKHGILGLVIIGVITAFFATQLSKVRFNYDFTMFFPSDDPDLAYYEKITAEFGMYDDFLYVALFGEDVYSATFLNRVDSLTRTLEAWPEVEEVISPTNYSRMQITPLGVNSIRLYQKGGALDSNKVSKDQNLPGQYFARDGKSVGLVVKHQEYTDKPAGDAFHRKLTSTLDSTGFTRRIISGKVQAQDEFVQRLESDLSLNLTLALVLVIVTLALIFKTFRGIWLPLITLVVTCIWNAGLYGLLGKELDVLMVIIPPILLIVSMSDVIHLCNKYNELIRAGIETSQALKITMKEVGVATLLTSLTTAIGFLSLIILPISPIRSFGIFTAIGVLLAYLIAFSLIPCLLLIMQKPLNRINQGPTGFWKHWLSLIFIKAIRKRKLIMALSVVIGLLCLWCTSLLQQNTSILVGIEPNDSMATPVQFFDEQYDGYKPFELTMTLPEDQRLFSPGILQALDSIHDYLAQNHSVKHIQSPLTLIKSLNQALKGGAATASSIPASSDIRRIERLFNSSKLKGLRSQLVSKDGSTWRINGRSKDLGSAIYKVKNESLFLHLAQWEKQGLVFRLTGTAHLIDQTNELHVKSILSGLLVAIGVIAFLILAFTRSLRLMFISLIPNVLPLLAVGGMMGLLNVDLNLSTAIIFSVAFGIAVDDSIHFLSQYVLAKKKGRKTIYALKRAMLSTGKSIVLTSIVLFVGFAIFLQSGFSATYYIGFFVCTTLVAALIADLLLLPALLYRKD